MTDPENIFERLKMQHEKCLPFVAYRSSSVKGDLIRAFFQHSEEIYKTTDYSGTGFIFATFEKEKETILFPREHCEIVEAILHYDQQHNPTDGVMANSETPSGRNKHIDLVKKGIVAIERGISGKLYCRVKN